MRILKCIWKKQFIEKLEQKHHVSKGEVQEVFDKYPRFNFIAKGHVKGEDFYRALGRTDAGRYLAVFFVHKRVGQALVISARDMTRRERRRYGKK